MTGSCFLRRHPICETPCSFHFIFLYQHRGFLSALANSSWGLQGWEDTVYKSSQNFRSLSQSSLNIHLRDGLPGQMLEMKGFRSFSKMTLLCLQSGFFIAISLEDSNMFALWRRELGWPLNGQLRPCLFFPFMAWEESILDQGWPTIINPVLFSNESRACIRERARAEELVLLARSWTTSHLGRISLSPHGCSVRTRAASPGCLHWGKFAWNFNLPSDEKCVSTGTRSRHRLPNERMTFSLMGQFLRGGGQRAWGSPKILEGPESQEFTTDSRVSQVKCSSEL